MKSAVAVRLVACMLAVPGSLLSGQVHARAAELVPTPPRGIGVWYARG